MNTTIGPHQGILARLWNPERGAGHCADVLHRVGAAKAVEVLAAVHRARPADRDVLTALATFQAKRGEFDPAVAWAQKLVNLRS